MHLQPVTEHFCPGARPVSHEPFGNGHINGTYLVTLDNGEQMVLQRINTNVFHDPVGLMHNIVRVTDHLKKRGACGRGVLNFMRASDGEPYAVVDGIYWRMYRYVEGSVCFQRADASLFFDSAAAFGRFQNMLSDFSVSELNETIPHFHDTPKRVQALREAVALDPCGRAESVSREVAFALGYEAFSHTLCDMQARGELPLRVTHNDTKINNVLFDEVTRKPLCVIDLDTVMPGLSVTDFGDAIRFGATTADEDERDLARVHFDIDLYERYVEGYLGACGESLTQGEIEMLPVGAMMMTYECGVRFLSDHINGDVYFGIAREGHNLDRARTQFKLLSEMDARLDDMRRMVEQRAPKRF